MAAPTSPCGHPRAEARVAHRGHNHSAFNGYRYTYSDYSEVRCTHPGCGRRWRTKAEYVNELPGECERRGS